MREKTEAIPEKKSVVIIGGGFAGLSCAYDISTQKNIEVIIFEAQEHLGGLAAGIKMPEWEWSIERAYHHLFASDKDILSLLKEVGVKVHFSRPQTTWLYKNKGTYSLFRVDGPIELLLFPLLSIISRLRAALFFTLMKISPFIRPIYEAVSAQRLVSLIAGKEVYYTLFSEPLQKKFGKYAGNIVASFLWSRIKKRSMTLGYVTGGFEVAIERIKEVCLSRGVRIKTKHMVTGIEKSDDGGYEVHIIDDLGNPKTMRVNYVVSTLCCALTAKIAKNILSQQTVENYAAIEYLSATNIIIETDNPVFDSEYWVSVCDPQIPALVFVQHTHYIDKNHYGGKHILYIGNYHEEDGGGLSGFDAEEMVSLFENYLRAISKNNFSIYRTHIFTGKYAQPVFDRKFISQMPKETELPKGFFLANIDETYPNDRGTNYAVSLGRGVASKILKCEALSNGEPT